MAVVDTELPEVIRMLGVRETWLGMGRRGSWLRLSVQNIIIGLLVVVVVVSLLVISPWLAVPMGFMAIIYRG